MNLSVDIYLTALAGGLREEVLAHVDHEHARSQLLATIDTLEKLAGLADWSPDLMIEQTDALATALAALSERSGSIDLPQAAETPREALSRHETAFDAVIDHIYGAAVEPGNHAATEAILRDSLRQYLGAERCRISAANFSAMT